MRRREWKESGKAPREPEWQLLDVRCPCGGIQDVGQAFGEAHIEDDGHGLPNDGARLVSRVVCWRGVGGREGRGFVEGGRDLIERRALPFVKRSEGGFEEGGGWAPSLGTGSSRSKSSPPTTSRPTLCSSIPNARRKRPPEQSGLHAVWSMDFNFGKFKSTFGGQGPHSNQSSRAPADAPGYPQIRWQADALHRQLQILEARGQKCESGLCHSTLGRIVDSRGSLPSAGSLFLPARPPSTASACDLLILLLETLGCRPSLSSWVRTARCPSPFRTRAVGRLRKLLPCTSY